MAGGEAEDDPDRFDWIVKEHLAGLRSAALRLCGNPSDAHDLVQDTLERALARRSRFQPGTNDWAWLYTILHNLFIDYCRKRRRERLAVPIGELPAPVETPSMWQSVTLDQVRAVLDRVEDKFRLVFEYHDMDGCSYEEIGRRLGIPYATVGTRLHRARRRIKELLATELARSERAGRS
jgi:RNA polymerase sigma-70 factor (ECF subfamily)